jgi:hypothetical protein
MVGCLIANHVSACGQLADFLLCDLLSKASQATGVMLGARTADSADNPDSRNQPITLVQGKTKQLEIEKSNDSRRSPHI